MSILSKIASALSFQGKVDDPLGPGRGWESLFHILPFSTGKYWKDASDIFGKPTVQDMESSFGNHPVVKACVSEIMNTITKPRLEIGTMKGKEWVPEETHPSLDLLENPNTEYGLDTLLQSVVSHASLTGSGFIWKARGRNSGRAVRLWSIPTSWVTPVSPEKSEAADRIFAGYKIWGHGSTVYPPEDVIALRLVDPATVDKSVGGLESCYRDYRLDIERSNYHAEVMENLKVPGLMIITDGSMSEEQRRRLKEDIEGKYGKGRRFRTLVLSGKGLPASGTRVEVLNPLADLDWPGLSSLAESRICSAFGVPPIVIHCRFGLERSTYANYQAARVAFMTGTMVNWWNSLAASLTFGILRQDKIQGLVFRFRYDELPEFQETKAVRSARARGEFATGIVDRDEARKEIGYEADPKNNSLVPPSQQSQPTPDTGDNRDPATEPNPDEENGGNNNVREVS